MKLKEARQDAGLRQDQFAHLMGPISPVNVSQVESGTRKAWPRFRARASAILDFGGVVVVEKALPLNDLEVFLNLL